MAFFPRTVCNNGNASISFNPLFRLLEDFDKYSRQDSHSNTGSNISKESRAALFHWQPKFDVRETANAYHLHGELPGVSRDQISIDFPESQHIVIRGKTERTYTTGAPAAVSEEKNSPVASPLQATVEDDDDEEVDVRSINSEGTESKAAPSAVSAVPATPATAKARYWLSERSIGEFSRTFTFPSRIDEDNVTASLKDGVLHVEIPKAKKYETRSVFIN